MTKILVTDRFTTEALERLRLSWDCEILQSSTFPSSEELVGVQGLLIRSRTSINQELLNRAKDLKIVVSATSGTDHMDQAACAARGIVALHTPEANSTSAAELTLLLTLGTLRNLSSVQKTLRQSEWRDLCPIGSDLHGKTVGIIGLGRVGTKVAKFLQAFGAEVLAHDPYQNDRVFQDLHLQRLGLVEVLTQSQIVTLHVPLNKETKHMICEGALAHCQHGVVLINTSRGSVVDERALISALDSGQIRAAGLDVFENEPLARDSRLRKYPQVYLTPHIGAYTEQALARASSEAVDILLKYLKDGRSE